MKSLIKSFWRWVLMNPHERRGCNGMPFHNGMCECECRTHYLGL